jgi:6-phosphogluconolactonase
MLKRHDFPDMGRLSSALAAWLHGRLNEAVLRRGQVSMILAGGSTPRELYQRLAQRSLIWDRLFFTLSDERMVPLSDERSNEGHVRSWLQPVNGMALQLLGLQSRPGQNSSAEIESLLHALPKPFSITLLGMGEDGHTASLFPGSPELSSALDPPPDVWTMRISHPSGPPQRITLTLPALLATEHVVLLAAGEKKRQVLERALGPGPVEELPLRALLRQSLVPISLYWSEEEP